MAIMFTHHRGDEYVITGTDMDGKRFKIQTKNARYALGINVFRGSLWQIKAGEKRRRLLCRYFN